jgi:hypothetical protein
MLRRLRARKTGPDRSSPDPKPEDKPEEEEYIYAIPS